MKPTGYSVNLPMETKRMNCKFYQSVTYGTNPVLCKFYQSMVYGTNSVL